MNASDIDLNASYSDDDYDAIPINEKHLFEYLQKVEENNLFEMNLLQDNQQTLEKIEAESAQSIAAKRRKIAELDSNIRQLQDGYKSRQQRLTYFKNMTDSSSEQQ